MLWNILLSCQQLEMVSPANDVTFESTPWIPVSLRFEDWVGPPEEITFELNGEPWVDPLAITRKRWSGKGGGYDYIGYLDLQTLPNGVHEFKAVARFPRRRTRTARSQFVVARPTGQIDVFVADEQGIPLDARVVIYKGGEPYNFAAPNSVDIDPSERDQNIPTVLTTMGHTQINLPAGEYTLTVYRGFRESIHRQEIAITDNTQMEINATIAVMIETEGWSTSDFHVHTARSADAFVPSVVRYKSIQSTDLDSVMITEHNQINDPQAEAFSLLEDMKPVFFPGNEATVGYYNDSGNFSSRGHVNVFPLSVVSEEAPLPSNTLDTVAQLIDSYQDRQVMAPFDGSVREVLTQLNHPRGIQFFPDRSVISAHPLFTHYGYDSSEPLTAEGNEWLIQEEPETGTRVIDFDSMEIINRFSWSLYKRVRLDWFALLNQGYHITGTGNSDSHALEVEQIGFPLNFVPCPRQGTSREAYDIACLVRSVQDGEVMVSNGPILDIEVQSGEERTGIGGMLSSSETVTVALTVRAVDWVAVEEMRLIVNGRQVEQVSLLEWERGEEGELNAALSFALNPSVDSWLIVEAGRRLDRPLPAEATTALREEYGEYAKIAVGHVPIAFTNPIYIDADVDGVWTPPGL